VDDNLFSPVKVVKNKPRKSYKFDSLSLYYDGKYYFVEDIKPTENTFRIEQGKPFEIQVVYYSYKWFQDTFYIDKEFKEFLQGFI
jgi:hypothetical protein